MAEYKIIFKADQETEGDSALTWEPGCPALVTAIQISRNTETSATYLQVKIRNVSDVAISSIFAGLEVSLPDGSVDRAPLEYLDVDIPAGAETALKPISLSHSDISSCALAISRIDQASGKWQTSTPAQPLPERKTLPYLSSRAIDQRARALNAEVTDDILRGAVQDHGDWWVCACGQVNVKRDTCCDCNQKKTLLQANEDETKLLAEADKHDEQLFNEAKKLQAEGTISSLTKAVGKFKSLGNYSKASDHAAECEAELAKLTATRNKRLKIIAAAVGAMIAIATVTAIVITQVIIPEQARKAEEERAAQEQAAEEAEAANEIQTLRSAQVGNVVNFGFYEQDDIESNGKDSIAWYVCARDGNKALLVSKYSLDCRPFGSNCRDYESSDLKKWLNNEFITEAFTSKQIDNLQISPLILSQDDSNQYYATTHFGSPTNYAARKASDGRVPPNCYWTSTTTTENLNGSNPVPCVVSCRITSASASSPSFVSSSISYYGYVTYHYVRPAIWITL